MFDKLFIFFRITIFSMAGYLCERTRAVLQICRLELFADAGAVSDAAPAGFVIVDTIVAGKWRLGLTIISHHPRRRAHKGKLGRRNPDFCFWVIPTLQPFLSLIFLIAIILVMS